MRHILFHFVEVHQPVLKGDALPEVPPVQLKAQDGFIKVLEFPKREFFGQEVKDHGLLQYLLAKALKAGIEDQLMVKGHFSKIMHQMPMKLIVWLVGLVIADIYKRIISYGNYATTRVTVYASISKITSDKIASVPAPSFESALAGKAAGVQVTTTSGLAGSGAVMPPGYAGGFRATEAYGQAFSEC